MGRRRFAGEVLLEMAHRRGGGRRRAGFAGHLRYYAGRRGGGGDRIMRVRRYNLEESEFR
jgi:hypothetical protein